MVDFNNETIVNASAKNILTIIYLQRSEWLQDAWEEYYNEEQNNIETTKAKSKIKARLTALFNRLRPTLKKSLSEKDFIMIQSLVKSENLEDWEFATNELEQFLYDKNITKLDTARPYDPTDIEAENAAYGLWN